MQNEELIIKNIQKGIDVEKGFRTLVTLYKERIYWHIRGIVKTHEDAADVMQNTFLKAYKNIGTFKSDSKFYTWMYRIATNESLNHLQKQKKYKSEEAEHEVLSLEADTYFDGDEAQMILQKALESLPDKQRIVFNMKYFDDMSYNDISEVLGTSVGGLKASFHHAKNKIEAFVKQQSL
ncbi:RNA polymerase sigma factor [Portibacter lacus]|uniref:DNA-directed RNA polymerase sigma-70 factor n=1 Tax=Portibacter lacus TaxID=1099794 RepID=A0AA37WGB5_9BACT|nr:RNA polymerase sigma factor [Portibacter lacus]GLR17820.1 DNA-directed RNA polymerase sigma-70 factor [Portibacter lacus]